MTPMKIVQFSRPSTPLVHQHPKFFHPLDLICAISNESSFPIQMITNQLKENNPRMLPGPSLRSAFVFNTNPLILFGFPLTSFHLAEASLCAFLWLYTLVCAVVQKYYEMLFIIISTHFNTKN